MRFIQLAQYLKELENTSSRLSITKILAEVFKKADTKEIDKITYLLLGRLGPRYEEVVFNIAEAMMIESISTAYSADKEKVVKLYKSTGDLGVVAENLAGSGGGDMSVSEVFAGLYALAKEEGSGSQSRKTEKMAELLTEVGALGARYLARIPLGKLRLGFSDKTIIDALSWYEAGDKSLRKPIEKAYEVMPDVGRLASAIKEKGVTAATLSTEPVVGIPILPMLAQRLKSTKEMIAKMGEVAVEPKLDGLRTQIHFKRGQFTKAYTRNLNEISWMFPELDKLSENVNASELIIDTEAVGLDEGRQGLSSFQKTMTRRRKHEIEKASGEIPIKFYVFDILFKDGENLMDQDYKKRRKVLEDTVTEGKLFNVVQYITTNDPLVIAKEEENKVLEGLEGIIVKKIDSTYVPGRTGWRWVKMKEAEEMHAKLGDTIDCVIMGYTSGRGKRAEFGIGQFLAGVVDHDTIKTVTKVGTGMTDLQFRDLKKLLSKLETKKKPLEYDVDRKLEPDYWVHPSVVVELAADEITKSPVHTSGYALRFPRLITIRADKSPQEATTLGEIKRLAKL